MTHIVMEMVMMMVMMIDDDDWRYGNHIDVDDTNNKTP